MEVLLDIINNNLVEILGTVIVAVASWIGVQIKNAYTKYVDTKTKKEIVKSTVEYVEQICKTLEVKPKAEEKFLRAKTKAQEWLLSKGIEISDTEIEILIESAVNSLKKEVK